MDEGRELAPEAAANEEGVVLGLLSVECEVFCRYLAGFEPPPYVVLKYIEAHESGRNGPIVRSDDALEEALVRLARRGVVSARAADAYASVFRPSGTLRRKLVLLLAILETFGPTSARVDTPNRRTRLTFGLELLKNGALFIALFAAAFVLLLPASLFARRPLESFAAQEGRHVESEETASGPLGASGGMTRRAPTGPEKGS